MTYTAFIVLACAALVCAICTVLVFHPDYNDGLIRRTALALLAIGSYLRFVGILEHHDGLVRTYSNVAILIWLGLALFMADHLRHFLVNVKRSRNRQRRAQDSPRNGSTC